jgi:hypothetical protein
MNHRGWKRTIRKGALAMRRKLVHRIPDHTVITEAELDRQHIEHRLSSKARLDTNTDDIARMVAEFAASRGITKCKPAYTAVSPHYRV